MTDIVCPNDAALPHTGGRLVAYAHCLAGEDRHLWLVLAYYADRRRWWATEGEWWSYLYNSASGSYVAGIQESNHNRAIDLFADRLKQHVRRFIDGSPTTKE